MKGLLKDVFMKHKYEYNFDFDWMSRVIPFDRKGLHQAAYGSGEVQQRLLRRQQTPKVEPHVNPAADHEAEHK